MKKTVEDGTVTYTELNGRRTQVTVQQDVHDKRRGNPEGVWYVFRITATKVHTEFYGRKSECMRYAERLVEELEATANKKGRKCLWVVLETLNTKDGIYQLRNKHMIKQKIKLWNYMDLQ